MIVRIASRPCMVWLTLFPLLAAPASASARTQPVETPPVAAQPPLPDGNAGQCDYFSRLYRFAEESKALCEDARQVKPGPLTTRIIAQCRAAEGARFAQAPVDDLMDGLTRQISTQGIGNACHVVSVQVWDLISQ